MKVAIIAWFGNVDDVTYVVPVDRVDAFMAKFNDHGNWQVVKTTMSTFFLENI